MAKILVADDDGPILRQLERFLAGAGHQVVCFDRSADALSVLPYAAFELALVDYEMPAPNGLQLLRQLRAVQPLCARVLMSGHLDLPVLIDAVNDGEVARVVVKPFRRQELLQAIDSTLEARDRMQAVLLAARAADAEQERQALDECLRGDVIRLALQPIVDVRSDAPIGFEALIRSRHPVLDQPLRVLQAAENLGRLNELGGVVTGRVAEWLPRLPEAVRLFVNLHPQEMRDTEQLALRVGRLERWASRLVFEVTEKTYMLDLEEWQTSVAMLRQGGFSLAVDDLGAGYNSLSVLAELQPDYIKVDMSIVRGVESNRRKQSLIGLLSRFAEANDAELIAEGVETGRESDALRECGAYLQQGFHFGRPSERLPEVPGRSDPDRSG